MGVSVAYREPSRRRTPRDAQLENTVTQRTGRTLRHGAR